MLLDLEQVRRRCRMTGLDRAVSDPVVRVCLESAGWYSAYRWDAAPWLRWLGREGFSVHQAALEALTSLGGLRIVPPQSNRAVFGTGTLLVDPQWAASGESPRIRERERELGSRLCPVGEWMDEYIVLLAEDGSVLAETTYQVLKLGKDLGEALVRIIVADSLPVELSV
jgi:hypothetical protein